ncbi:MAG TPA: hypothetical protein VL092_11915 [Chitinophagaceae bacterium]|nr:hypothetical protein [Chitinophagaceae bacterium]
MSNYNPKINNVESVFTAIDKDGKQTDFSGEPWVANIVESHVQGVARYGDYWMLTYNNKGYSQGYLMAVNNDSGKLVLDFNTPDENYNHPSGIQTIGNFLLVPVENSDASDSYIHFYNMYAMNDTTQPTLLTYNIHRSGKGSGAAGICNFTDNDGNERYFMCVYDNGATDFYTSNAKTLSDPNISFTLSGSIKLDQEGYSSTCLVTDTDGSIYMIGFRVEGSTSYTDYADLYKITLNSKYQPSDMKGIGQKHCVTDYGSMTGIAGVHFRWGAGIYFRNNNTQFGLLATQRNFVANNLTVNKFNQG